MAAVLTVLGFLATVAYLAITPDAFNGNVPNFEVVLLDTTPIYFYAGYWAFSLRHALAVPLYRRQASGIGFVVLAIWGALAEFTSVPRALSLQIYVPITTFTFYFLLFVIFYWIDASVLASRRSDPLLRDTLYWSKVRTPLWIANFIIWGVPLVIVGYASISGDSTLLNQLNSGTFPNFVPGIILGIIYNVLPILVPIIGIIYLPAIATRSKWDKTLRMHFVWFAPVVLFLLVLFLNFPNTFEGHILPALIISITGFTLYKSAKALVPLNTISHLEIAPKEPFKEPKN
jgi:hypothetical protein